MDKVQADAAAVVICFQISIFEPLETASSNLEIIEELLWFAFKLVSLNHWKQQTNTESDLLDVVICFQISIFEPLETAGSADQRSILRCDLLSN